MRQRRLSLAVLIADLCWALVAMAAALLLRYGTHWGQLEETSAAHMLPFLGATWVVWTLLSISLPLDGFQGGWRLSAIISQLSLSVGFLMLMLLSCGYLLRQYVSRLALVQFGLLLFVGYILIRIAACLLIRTRSRNGFIRRVVIVGRGRLVGELTRKIQRHPEMLCRVVGFLAPDDGKAQADVDPSIPSECGSALSVMNMLCRLRVDEMILILQEGVSTDLLNLTAVCRDRGIRVSVVPQLYELYSSRSHLIDLDGLPVFQSARPGLSYTALAWKRALDLVLGTLFSLVALPVLLPLAIVLRRRKGKAFCREDRCGLEGKRFAMLRLNVERTANHSSRFEGILHELGLTELPQLWNVMRGDMTLVGPRPESPHRVCRYSEWQRQRLTVKPGMTGLAQVQGLREQHSSEDKTRFDLQYLLIASPWTDLSLLLQTIWTLSMRFIPWSKPSADRGTAGTPSELGTGEITEELFENAHRP